MSGVVKVSRTDLYSDEEFENGSKDVILPELEFEIINTQKNDDDEVQQNDSELQEEFDFPLFSFGESSSAKPMDKDESKAEQDRGLSLEKQSTIKISLRSPSPEIIIQGRPDSYYFATCDDEVRKQFEIAAVTGDDIYKQSTWGFGYNNVGKVINLKQYNDKIENDLAREKRQKQIRPGKKKRLNRIESKKRNAERDQIQRNIEKQKLRKLMKKIHHKRGGKKNKKKQQQPAAATVPKYRTE